MTCLRNLKAGLVLSLCVLSPLYGMNEELEPEEELSEIIERVNELAIIYKNRPGIMPAEIACKFREIHEYVEHDPNMVSYQSSVKRQSLSQLICEKKLCIESTLKDLKEGRIQFLDLPDEFFGYCDSENLEPLHYVIKLSLNDHYFYSLMRESPASKKWFTWGANYNKLLVYAATYSDHHTIKFIITNIPYDHQYGRELSLLGAFGPTKGSKHAVQQLLAHGVQNHGAPKSIFTKETSDFLTTFYSEEKNLPNENVLFALIRYQNEALFDDVARSIPKQKFQALVNRPNEDGVTALDIALVLRYRRLIAKLLLLGADPWLGMCDALFLAHNIPGWQELDMSVAPKSIKELICEAARPGLRALLEKIIVFKRLPSELIETIISYALLP